MARKYGDRWLILEPIGRGGQSEVFRVADLSSPSRETAALKWIKNPKRHPRFENEVAAIQRLDDPHVIKLLDHSALENPEGKELRQFIVMPEALGGDLSSRAAAMEDSIDTTLIIAKQIASALVAAHAASVIHRDVKPENVLFSGSGNEVWLADFGICLISDKERPTETGEVTGPWAFMAPELEGGGQLDVTPAADVYSLGKVIYYMLSGGIILPRERLDEKQYSHIFFRGGRYQAIELLLSRMIAPLQARIGDMRIVVDEIDRLMKWDETAVQLPFKPESRLRLEAMKIRTLESQRVAAEAQATEAALQKARKLVSDEVHGRLLSEAEQVAISQNDGLAVRARAENLNESLPFIKGSPLRPLQAVQLGIEFIQSNRVHYLQFQLCSRITTEIVFGSNNSRPRTERPIYIVPVYLQKPASQADKATDNYFYLKLDGKLISSSELFPLPNGLRQNLGPQQPTKIHCMDLFPSSWPMAEHYLTKFSSNIYDLFVSIMERNAANPFPF